MGIILFLILFAAALYGILKYIFSYWRRNGFPYLTPSIPYGNMEKFAKKQKSFGIAIWDMYKDSREPFVGVYIFTNPSLLARDVDLIRKILVTDVESFYDRGVYVNEEKEPISASLFTLQGNKWKNLRQKLSPLFSSGRLKNMFPTILTEIERLDVFMNDKAKLCEVVKMRDVLSNYVLNVIGSVFFGIDVDTINNPNHPFKEIHRHINNPGLLDQFRAALLFLAPKLIDILHMSSIDATTKDFFSSIVRGTIEQRETQNVRRNDFMQLMIELRNTGKISDNENTLNPTVINNAKKELSIEEIAGNTFLFFIAGTDTTAQTASYCIYELALQLELMEKVQNEIDETLTKHNGQITYDSIQEMEYLEMCIKETLRKYPGLPMLNRQCTKDYPIPDTNFTIKKGTNILISIMGLHYDSKYFEHPYDFVPERFRKGVETFNKDAYIPFGDGPKQCIAVRMGFLGAKVAVIKLLSRYNFEVISRAPIEFAKDGVGLAPEGDLPMRVSLR